MAASGSLRVGLAGSIGQLTVEPRAIDGDSRARLDTQTVSLLATWQSRAGWYVDAVLYAGWLGARDGRGSRPHREPERPQLRRRHRGGHAVRPGLAGSGGRAADPGDLPAPGLPQPHGRGRHRWDLGQPDRTTARISARLTRPIPLADGARVTRYLKLDLLHSFNDGDRARIGGVAFRTGEGGTSVQAGAGITGSLTRNLSVYADTAVQAPLGDAGLRGWSVSAGLRYRVGN
jgi:type V secretory pathway adhesin AidA